MLRLRGEILSIRGWEALGSRGNVATTAENPGHQQQFSRGQVRIPSQADVWGMKYRGLPTENYLRKWATYGKLVIYKVSVCLFPHQFLYPFLFLCCCIFSILL